jgi:diacylglycerol kinase family enzyme
MVMRRILVLLNADAGTVLDRGADAVRTLVERELGQDGREIDVRLLSSRKLVEAIGAAREGTHDTVIVGGGDGSVNLAASALVRSDKTLGILPLGTLNLLARDIGMPLDLQQALATLDEAKPHRIDLGTINGRLFHTISGIGFFSQMARAREAARHWKLGRFFVVAIAAFFALRRAGRFALQVTIDGHEHDFEAFAALVTVNRFSGPGWRRARLDEGMMEIHIAEDRGALAKLKAGADMVTDSWRGNPGIISLSGRHIELRRRRSRSWVSTDGELSRERIPLDYGIEPSALTLLMPRQREDASGHGTQRGSIS